MNVYRQEQARIFCSYCSYAPVVLVRAFDLDAYRIIPPQGGDSKADTWLPAYVCQPVRSSLAWMWEHRGYAEGVILNHACDTIQGLAQIWPRLFPEHKTMIFNIPSLLRDTPPVREFLHAELKKLIRVLEEYTGHSLDKERLAGEIARENTLRQKLRQLREQEEGYTSRMHRTAVQALADTPDKALSLVEEQLQAADSNVPGLPVVVTGALLHQQGVIEALESAGARVKAADLCTALRWYGQDIPETGDPLQGLLEYYLSRPPCPCKDTGLGSREDYLNSLIQETGARGMIFLLQKFCDPHLWDQGIMQKEFPVPLLTLELESPPSLGPLATRIGAFIEMVSDGRHA